MAISKDDNNNIASKRGKNGGYYLIKSINDIDCTVNQSSEAQAAKKIRERYLYPIVAQWLLENSISSKVSVVADFKGGATWSNPDVVGLSLVEDFDFFDVEILTAEVKPNLHNWRQFFFEAVSHKRFSERAYFIYASDGKQIDETELRRYSEKYKVGLVKIEFSEEEKSTIQNWNDLEVSLKVQLLERFVEIMPAPFEAIPIREKVGFLQQLGLNSRPELREFGDSNKITLQSETKKNKKKIRTRNRIKV